jgi:hypothetical protein
VRRRREAGTLRLGEVSVSKPPRASSRGGTRDGTRDGISITRRRLDRPRVRGARGGARGVG